MPKRIAKYIPFCKAGIQTFLTYKAALFIWPVILFVDIAFVFFLYNAIYSSSPDGLNSVINGFTFNEIVFYSLFAFIFLFTSSCSDTSDTIFDDVKEGTIANTLLKPVSYRLRNLCTTLGKGFIQNLLFGLPLALICYIVFVVLNFTSLEIWQIVVNFLLYIVFSFLALIINDAISYFLGLMSFVTQHVFGLNLMKEAIVKFCSGQLVPLSFMGGFGVALSYLPFSFLGSTPVLIILNKVEPIWCLYYLLIGIGWIGVIEIVNYVVFSSCMKKLVIQGG